MRCSSLVVLALSLFTLSKGQDTPSQPDASNNNSSSSSSKSKKPLKLFPIPLKPCEEEHVFSPSMRICLPNTHPCATYECPENAVCDISPTDQTICVANCKPGFEAKARSCQKYDPCEDTPCPENTICFASHVEPDKCIARCRTGYRADPGKGLCMPHPAATLINEKAIRLELRAIPTLIPDNKPLNETECAACIPRATCRYDQAAGRCSVTCEGKGALYVDDACITDSPCSRVNCKKGMVCLHSEINPAVCEAVCDLGFKQVGDECVEVEPKKE